MIAIKNFREVRNDKEKTEPTRSPRQQAADELGIARCPICQFEMIPLPMEKGVYFICGCKKR